MTESCGNCKFFQRIQPMQPAGLCRAEPPKPIFVGLVQQQDRITGNVTTTPQVATYFGQVHDALWCGGWRLRQVEKTKQTIDIGKLDIQELEGSA